MNKWTAVHLFSDGMISIRRSEQFKMYNPTAASMGRLLKVCNEYTKRKDIMVCLFRSGWSVVRYAVYQK